MSSQAKLFIYEEKTFTPGKNTFIDSVAEENAVVFEDNGETGYFYAVDPDNGTKVLDALHIYDTANIINTDKSSILKILWTEDLSICFLSINDYYHAAFDFKNKAGYCRNAFPESRRGWCKIKERKLTDELIEALSKINN